MDNTESAAKAESNLILVTGDVVLDHNIYAGQRSTPDSKATPGMEYRTEPGGAALTYGLLQALRNANAKALKDAIAEAQKTVLDAAKPGTPPVTSTADIAASLTPGYPDATVAFGIEQSEAEQLRDWHRDFHTGAVWAAVDGPGKGERRWRLSENLGYGKREDKPYPGRAAADLNKHSPRVLVIDDGGLGFRKRLEPSCWPEFLLSDDVPAPDLQWIILKMSRPLGRGDLWEALVKRWRERVIVVVSADNMRREDVSVSRGLSWESTVDDLVEEIRWNPAIAGLKECRHLVITLRGDAALWMEPNDNLDQPCRLVFDRERGEGEWEDTQTKGGGFGFLSAMTTAIAWNLRTSKFGDAVDLVPALKAGLSTTRFLREYGHGCVDEGEYGFPFAKAAAEILMPKTQKYASSVVQCAGVCAIPATHGDPSGWSMLGQMAHSAEFKFPLYGVARRLALLGPGSVENVPCARFGKLLTMDRREIEALRSMRQLMLSYKNVNPQKQPLSVAVFGAPGSGKSFGLKQIAEAIFGEKNPVLEFNLSQFKGPEDLIGAYHQVRDAVLAGFTPVVFWDEFDSEEYRWLRYLLAPMQDGKFVEGPITHTIGKCIFVFAGGTSRDFEHFGPVEGVQKNESAETREKFIMAKGPDFKSRLAGFFNVLGPNPRPIYSEDAKKRGVDPWVNDPDDLVFPVRRAMLLRSLLDYVKEKENEPLDIDRGLLTALLKTKGYLNGARSMEKLVLQMKDCGGVPLRRSHLPPDNLLKLYVEDVAEFHELVRSSYSFLAQAEKLARGIHNDWFANITPERRARGGRFCKPYDGLGDEEKTTNIVAALRMPEILASVGYVLTQGLASEEEDKEIRKFIEDNLDVLADMEHMGWDEQTRLEKWTPGKVWNDEKKIHNLLIPFDELPAEEKDKDRRAIRKYPEHARLAGFKIVPVENSRSANP